MFQENKILDEKWKIILIANIGFLVWGHFVNYKFLKTWIQMFGSIYWLKLIIGGRHAYESYGKKIV
jgi:hypothetical protein